MSLSRMYKAARLTGELLSQRPATDILEHVKVEEPVVYRHNGNRSQKAQDVLRRLGPLLQLVGITRVAEISQLIPYGFPVFQTVRPNLLFHINVGQNTGAQGKGINAAQAKLSSLMESIESYCAEPRVPRLVKGSYNYLKTQHVVFDPRSFVHRYRSRVVGLDEPLVWTESCSLEQSTAVLVPAEAVYFPFFPGEYSTRSVFACSSTGLAAGSTYLEAIVHGLYEVIERHYAALLEQGKLRIERFHVENIPQLDLESFRLKASDYKIGLFAMIGSERPVLPVVCCIISTDNTLFWGFGCCAHVETAITRALSEAWQTVATVSSGSREDIERPGSIPVPGRFRRYKFPGAKTLRLDDYKKMVVDCQFDSLRTEYEFLLGWLHSAGFENVCIVNLTRVGLDVPVIRALIPGMLMPFEYRPPGRIVSTTLINKMRFGA